MPTSDRLRIVVHGCIAILVGFFCGLPAVPEEEAMRLWHTAHEGLVMIGVLLLAVSSVMPLLVLEKRESKALIWSLLTMTYGLMTGLIIQGIMGQHAFGPSSDPPLMIAFIGSALGIFGSVVSVSLTLMGALAARTAARAATVS